ncbi:hypothetical protein BC940DRAFT_330482 [Gongronella butleri]|nr:hypothetical protein BC940DRAFT_330482 [Gongronella butleri]
MSVPRTDAIKLINQAAVFLRHRATKRGQGLERRLQSVNVLRLIDMLVQEESSQRLQVMATLLQGIINIQESCAGHLYRNVIAFFNAMRRELKTQCNPEALNIVVDRSKASHHTAISLPEIPHLLDMDVLEHELESSMMMNLPHLMLENVASAASVATGTPLDGLSMDTHRWQGVQVSYEMPELPRSAAIEEARAAALADRDTMLDEADVTFDLLHAAIEEADRTALTRNWIYNMSTTTNYDPIESYEVPSSHVLQEHQSYDFSVPESEFDWHMNEPISREIAEPQPVPPVPVWAICQRVGRMDDFEQDDAISLALSDDWGDATRHPVPAASGESVPQPLGQTGAPPLSQQPAVTQDTQTTAAIPELVPVTPTLPPEDNATPTPPPQPARRRRRHRVLDRGNTTMPYTAFTNVQNIITHPDAQPQPEFLAPAPPTTANQFDGVHGQIRTPVVATAVPGLWERLRTRNLARVHEDQRPFSHHPDETEAARGGIAHDATSLLTDDPLHFPAEEPRNLPPSAPRLDGSRSDLALEAVGQTLHSATMARDDSPDFDAMFEMEDAVADPRSTTASSFRLLRTSSGANTAAAAVLQGMDGQEPDFANLMEIHVDDAEPAIEDPGDLELFYLHLRSIQAAQAVATANGNTEDENATASDEILFSTAFSPSDPLMTRHMVALAFFNTLVLVSQSTHPLQVHQATPFGPISLRLTTPQA